MTVLFFDILNVRSIAVYTCTFCNQLNCNALTIVFQSTMSQISILNIDNDSRLSDTFASVINLLHAPILLRSFIISLGDTRKPIYNLVSPVQRALIDVMVSRTTSLNALLQLLCPNVNPGTAANSPVALDLILGHLDCETKEIFEHYVSTKLTCDCNEQRPLKNTKHTLMKLSPKPDETYVNIGEMLRVFKRSPVGQCKKCKEDVYADRVFISTCEYFFIHLDVQNPNTFVPRVNLDNQIIGKQLYILVAAVEYRDSEHRTWYRQKKHWMVVSGKAEYFMAHFLENMATCRVLLYQDHSLWTSQNN